MKNKRFQYRYRSNASLLHKAVGDCLRTDKPFGEFEFYQEYPVNKVNKNYPSGSHKFDWVCTTLGIVIECHGKQHYEVVDFGFDKIEDAIEAFKNNKKRDEAKKLAALDANYVYIEIPYTLQKKINAHELRKLFKLGLEVLSVYNKDNLQSLEPKNIAVQNFKEKQKQKAKEFRKKYLASDKHQEQLKKAREFRQSQYREQKEKEQYNA
jgi:very-short-patch-repair endonuclease